MKKNILWIFILGVALASPAQALFMEDAVSGEIWIDIGHYVDGDTEGEAGIYFSSEPGFSYLTKVSFQAVSGSIGRQGSDIFSRDGENPIFSLRELYIDKGIFQIGKQTFVNVNGINFDFVSLNPFEVRDLSRPFSTLDEGRLLGSWGASVNFMDKRFEIIASLIEPPTFAMSSKNPWTRELPAGLYYDDVQSEAEYSVGIRWGDSVGDVDYNLALQHGSGNSPVGVNINATGEVNPVIAEQTAISAAIQNPVGEFNLRLGLAEYLQEDYSDFVVGVVEIERVLENVIRDGDSLFVDVGYADVWETKSGSGIPELDLRRIYEGGTALMTAEYAIQDWVIKLKAAYNLEYEGIYIAPEVSWLVTDTVELSLKCEAIDGRSDSGQNTIWSEHSDDDNIMLKVIITF